MDDDRDPPALRERVRWGNVAKAAAVVALVAVVIAWPRLSSDAPALPKEDVVVRGPVRPAAPDPAPVPVAPAGDDGARPRAKGPPARKGPRAKKRKPAAKKRARRKRPERGRAPRSRPAAPAAPAPAPPPPSGGGGVPGGFSGGGAPSPRSRPHPNGGEFVPG